MQKPFLLFFGLIFSYFCVAQTENQTLSLFSYRSQPGELVAPGISDPSLDSSVAVDQAKFRAKMMLALMNDMVLGELTTINMGNENASSGALDSDFEILYTSKFIAKISDTLLVEYTLEDFSENKEAIVFAKFTDTKDTTKLIDSTGVSVIITRNISLEPKTQRWAVSSDNMEISAKDTGGSTNLYMYNLNSKIIQSFNMFPDASSLDKRFTGNKYNYKDKKGSARFGKGMTSDITLKNKSRINNGLWSGMVEMVSQELCIAASLINSKQNLLVSSGIENTTQGNDAFSKTEFYQSAKNLSFNHFSFGFSNLSIEENELSMDISIESESFNGNLNVSPSGSYTNESEIYSEQLLEEGWGTFIEDDFKITAGSIWEMQQIDSEKIYANGNAVAINYNTAALMSLEMAKLKLASLYTGDRFSIVSSNTGEVESETLQSAKTVTKAELEGIHPYYFLHRKLDNGLFEVQVHISHDLVE